MKKLFFLDGIRGWGAFTVLIYHLFVNGLPVSSSSSNFLFRLFIFNGTLAVWLFFIVSGFSLSIGYTLSDDRSKLFKLIYARYFRLAIPILAFSLLMYVMQKFQLIPLITDRPEQFKYFLFQPPELIKTIYFGLFNVFFNYTDSTSLLPPLWTMHIELFGSFFILSLCLILGNKKNSLIPWALIFLFSFFLAPYYAAFFAGVLFAKFYSYKPVIISRIPFFSLILGILLALILPYFNNPKLYLIVAMMLFTGMAYCKPVKNFLESNLSKFMGKISFTLYLLHAIVIWSFALPIIIFLNKYGHPTVLILLVINLATTVISLTLSNYLVVIDEYAVRVSRKFSKAIFFMLHKIILPLFISRRKNQKLIY